MNDPQQLLWNNTWADVDKQTREELRKTGVGDMLKKKPQKGQRPTP